MRHARTASAARSQTVAPGQRTLQRLPTMQSLTAEPAQGCGSVLEMVTNACEDAFGLLHSILAHLEPPGRIIANGLQSEHGRRSVALRPTLRSRRSGPVNSERE